MSLLSRRELLLKACQSSWALNWARSMTGLAPLLIGSEVKAANKLQVGKPAPPLVLHTLDGKSLATQDLKGKVILIHFWATWCAPCLEELPRLSRFYDQHAHQGFEVLGFSLDGPDALPKVKRMASQLSFPVGLLGSSYAGDFGRIWSLPVSFVIERSGRLAVNGWDDADPAWTNERLNSVVLPLIEHT